MLERDVSGRLRTAALSRGILVRRYTTVSAATPDHVWLHPAAAVFDGAALASAWELKSVATQATKAKFRPGQLPELCELVSAGLVAGAVVYVTSEAQWGVWRAPRRGQAAWCALMTASCWSVCTDGWLASPEAVVQLITGWVLSPRPPRP